MLPRTAGNLGSVMPIAIASFPAQLGQKMWTRMVEQSLYNYCMPFTGPDEKEESLLKMWTANIAMAHDKGQLLVVVCMDDESVGRTALKVVNWMKSNGLPFETIHESVFTLFSEGMLRVSKIQLERNAINVTMGQVLFDRHGNALRTNLPTIVSFPAAETALWQQLVTGAKGKYACVWTGSTELDAQGRVNKDAQTSAWWNAWIANVRIACKQPGGCLVVNNGTPGPGQQAEIAWLKKEGITSKTITPQEVRSLLN